MTYKDFYYSIEKLKSFFKEQDKLNNVIKVISPTSTGVVEFGNEFVDDYICLVGLAMDDHNGWINWFVFENNFGKNKMKATVNNKKITVVNVKQLYDIIKK